MIKTLELEKRIHSSKKVNVLCTWRREPRGELNGGARTTRKGESRFVRFGLDVLGVFQIRSGRPPTL